LICSLCELKKGAMCSLFYSSILVARLFSDLGIFNDSFSFLFSFF